MSKVKTEQEHTHDWLQASVVVPLHNYVTEGGKIVKDRIQGKDTLKQLACECGAVQTVDLERKKL